MGKAPAAVVAAVGTKRAGNGRVVVSAIIEIIRVQIKIIYFIYTPKHFNVCARLTSLN